MEVVDRPDNDLVGSNVCIPFIRLFLQYILLQIFLQTPDNNADEPSNIVETTKQQMNIDNVTPNVAKKTPRRHINDSNEIGKLVHHGRGYRMKENHTTSEMQATNKQLLDSEFSGNKYFVPMVSFNS